MNLTVSITEAQENLLLMIMQSLICRIMLYTTSIRASFLASAYFQAALEAARMAAEADKRRANPSARLSALYSLFESSGQDADLENKSMISQPNYFPDAFISASRQQPGPTAREHMSKARSAVVATWQMPAVPVFLRAPRPAAKACAAILAGQLTMSRVSKEVTARDQ
jgi:hypothetical protein